MDNKQLPISLLRREITWGIRYLLFELTFLGAILSFLLQFLGLGTDGLLLDTTYFVVNLMAVIWIFRSFLVGSSKHGIAHWMKLVIATVIGFALHFALTRLLDLAICWLMPEFFNVNDAGIYEHSRQNFLLTAFGAVILVPLAEETLFRGLVFGSLHAKGRLPAYIFSTLFFAFIHVMGYIGDYPPLVLLLCFIQYIPAGIALAGAYEYSGSILAPVLIHTAVNAFAILSMR